MNLLDKLKIKHRPRSGALGFAKIYRPWITCHRRLSIPGNWATNLAAGSEFGYALLWVVTFSSVMLIIIQHNVAHLGIVTGLCLSEATNKYMPRVLSRPILGSAMLASISTSLAEILGGAIALRMLFGMPIKAGAVIVTIVCLAMLFSNTYSKTERWIITFVSIIGLSFLYELALVDVRLGAGRGRLGETHLSRELHADYHERTGSRRDASQPVPALRGDTEPGMEPRRRVGHQETTEVRVLRHAPVHGDRLGDQLGDDHLGRLYLLQAKHRRRRAGPSATVIGTPRRKQRRGEFAAALLLAGISSTITSGIAGASIFAGFYGEAYNHTDLHSKLGVLLSFVPALAIIFLIGDPFKGLILSQMLLSVQLPITVFTQVYLTSSKKVMGVYANSRSTTILLLLLGTMVTVLNIALLISLF